MLAERVDGGAEVLDRASVVASEPLDLTLEGVHRRQIPRVDRQ
jgi:hypothetical protein